MKLTHLLLQFFTSFFLWFISIFITALSIFFFLRVFSYYLIGGHFLFSSIDVVKALKIGGYCSLLCNAVSWFLHWRNK
ncbi:TPA: hypothetical protein GFX47_22580 [Escherichia coli]|uniref:Uncharacterized protein n=1 Tax=Escherichia marmotae TaxID=1499973 RepID=A0A7Z8ZKQ9_9ESCH|nr:hypothetical protein DBZ19_00975 [Escherichia coli]EBQ9648912.1 hypothetical protein [Salmonella enterica subsp. enterica serovar Montevideo]CIN26209.1 Uncharacterised protein [Salmonella enterica subsp. enterica serovar Typhi]VED72930.1 Uncharacterised protein [Escherichia marmotae]EEY7958988.1 hypothetical protein [Escherichia coli]